MEKMSMNCFTFGPCRRQCRTFQCLVLKPFPGIKKNKSCATSRASVPWKQSHIYKGNWKYTKTSLSDRFRQVSEERKKIFQIFHFRFFEPKSHLRRVKTSQSKWLLISITSPVHICQCQLQWGILHSLTDLKKLIQCRKEMVHYGQSSSGF